MLNNVSIITFFIYKINQLILGKIMALCKHIYFVVHSTDGE